MKKVIIALMLLMGVSIGYAYEVGDIVGEPYRYERYMDTDRITVDEMEILYSFRIVSVDQQVVDSVNEGGYTTIYKSHDELQLIIEKVIPLTGNYYITLSIENLLSAIDDDKKYEWGGYVESWKDVPLIVIGDSCFEDNELVQEFCIEPDEICRSIKIGKRAFYGAINLRKVSCVDRRWTGNIDDNRERYKKLKLNYIDETAFEGCEKLEGLSFNCDELERIEYGAFKNCFNFQGIVSVCEGELSTGPYEWNTPKLEYIGSQAFYNTFTPVINGYIGFLEQVGVEWKFSNKDIIIGDEAFHMCAFLRAIHFPSNMQRIVEKSFAGLNMSDLLSGHGNRGYKTRLYFPDTLVTIGGEAFCNSVVAIDSWPSSLIEIGNSAFQNYSSINYSLNPEKTKLVSNLINEWENGLPLALQKLGENAFGSLIVFEILIVPSF